MKKTDKISRTEIIEQDEEEYGKRKYNKYRIQRLRIHGIIAKRKNQKSLCKLTILGNSM